MGHEGEVRELETPGEQLPVGVCQPVCVHLHLPRPGPV
jgi:hypothetical protein